MHVEVVENQCGDLEVKPVSERVRRKFSRHLAQFTHPDAFREKEAGTLYLQREELKHDFFDRCVPPRKARDIRAGWPTVINVDPEIYGHLLGWDCHLVEV